jgi:hypothetical protein
MGVKVSSDMMSTRDVFFGREKVDERVVGTKIRKKNVNVE